MKKVYLVIDCENVPGRVLAIFNNEEDAELFADMLEDSVDIEERSVFDSQPPHRGYSE